jgi:hypothetical protein
MSMELVLPNRLMALLLRDFKEKIMIRRIAVNKSSVLKDIGSIMDNTF